MKDRYDVVIIGAGPAGLSAAVYAERAKLKALLLEKEYMGGGQIVTTTEVDNYLGLPGMNGFDLAMKFREHAVSMGAEFAEGKVQSLARQEEDWCVKTEDKEYSDWGVSSHAWYPRRGASARKWSILLCDM